MIFIMFDVEILLKKWIKINISILVYEIYFNKYFFQSLDIDKLKLTRFDNKLEVAWV